ncbi:MAG: 6-carboxytetrahydropterin synthase [Nitrospinota bacterium]
MKKAHKIHIEKQKLNFSSAHFITFNENDCETLHGHNYYTTLELRGQPNENRFIIDFRIVKKEMQVICDSLDHKILIAMKNPHIKIKRSATQLEIEFRDRKYSLPLSDVAEMPIQNTTVEMLSEYICNELHAALDKKGYLSNITSIEVGVEETQGQMASCRIET